MMSNLSVPRSRRKLADKVLELGLVVDRTQLRKKRRPKDGGARRRPNNFTELSDLVSDEHSSSASESMFWFDYWLVSI